MMVNFKEKYGSYWFSSPNMLFDSLPPSLKKADPEKYEKYTLDKNEKLILGCILKWLGNNGWCSPSRHTIAHGTGTSIKTVARYLPQLIERGLVQMRTGKGINNIYVINFETVQEWGRVYRECWDKATEKDRESRVTMTLLLDGEEVKQGQDDPTPGSPRPTTGVTMTLHNKHKQKDIINILIEAGVKEEEAKKLYLKVNNEKAIQFQVDQYNKAKQIDPESIKPGLLYASIMNGYRESWWIKLKKKLIDPNADIRSEIPIYELRRHTRDPEGFVSETYELCAADTDARPTWYFKTRWDRTFIPYHQVETVEDLKKNCTDRVYLSDPENQLVKPEEIGSVTFIGGVKQNGQ